MFYRPSNEHTARKKFDANCFPLSDISVLGGPYLMIQCSTNAKATVHALILRNGITFVSFVNRSVTTNRNRYPFFVFVSGPSMSIDNASRGLCAGNNRNGCVRFRNLTRFLAHALHLRTVL